MDQVNLEDRAASKAEITCKVDGETQVSGIKCVTGFGNTCKKLKPCTAVTNIGDGTGLTYFSPEELENWLDLDVKENKEFMEYMWQNDWFEHPDEVEH